MPVGINAEKLKELHQTAHTYDAYLSDQERARPWRDNDARTKLASDQQTLLDSFVREMKVLVISGIWCGDCYLKGPMLAAIAAARRSPQVPQSCDPVRSAWDHPLAISSGRSQ